jgi:hypothetical protein
MIVVGRLEPRRDEAEIAAVRHLPVARRQRGRGLGEVSGVLLRAPLELLRHADAPEPLAQVRRELQALAIVEIEHERALPRECLTNRLRRDVRIAVHVAADPSAELDDDRHAHAAAALRERVCERALEAFVERRHHAVEHVGQEEQHVLGLVAKPYAFVQALDGLPARRHFLPDLPERRPSSCGVR